MMETRTLESPPGILPLYARAAASMIPGASLLPFFPGRGSEVPELELRLDAARPDPDQVAAYARVCGFSLRDHLPPTYPHVLAFPLHMAVMADGRFPFGAVGLVHIENRIVQHRRIGVDETLSIAVRPTKVEPHPRGRIFSLLTEARADGEKTWEGTSTMLRRGGGTGGEKRKGGESPKLTPAGEWRLGGDLGRRYGAVSGDRNPIHMHPLAAKPLGFPRAIAHGMWTKARCLAALESRLPDSFSVEVRFRKPILLPAQVEFALAAGAEETAFAVRDPGRGTPHLEGLLRPLETKQTTTRRKSK